MGFRDLLIIELIMVSLIGSINAETVKKECLSDIIHGISTCPWPFMSKLGIDQTYDSKLPLKINGKSFERGICVNAPSEIYVALDGEYRTFSASVGMQADTIGPVAFLIDLDGKRVLQIDRMDAADDPRPVSINVRNAKVMKLTVGGGSGKAVWGDAYLTKAFDTEPVDMAIFGTVKTWDPLRPDGVRFSRLEEFQADDLYRGRGLVSSRTGVYTVPIYPDGSGCIGMEWDEMRRLTEVGLLFADKSTIPSIDGVRVEGWVKRDPNAPGEYSTWQGMWIPLSGNIEQYGNSWRIKVNSKGDSQTAGGTYKIRWVFPASKSAIKIKDFIGVTSSRWETVEIVLQSEKSYTGKPVKVEIYNGSIIDEDRDVLNCKWDMSEPLKLNVKYTTPRPWAYDRTVIRLKLPKASFGIAIDDIVAKDQVYVKDAGLYASILPMKKSLAEYKKSIEGRKTILYRVRELPDQSLEQAMKALYQPSQDRSPTLLSLAWDNRKMVVDRDGSLRFGGPLVLNHYQFFYRYEIKPIFGSGTRVFGDKRELDGGWMPIPVITLSDNGLTYKQKTFVAPFGDSRPADKGGPWINEKPLGVAEYSISNPNNVPSDAKLTFGLTEHVRPSDSKLTEIASISAIFYAETKPKPIDTIVENDKIRMISSDGKTLAIISTGSLKADVTSGTIVLSGMLQPGDSVKCQVFMPIEWDVEPENLMNIADADILYRNTQKYWNDVMAPSMKITIPDQLLKDIIYASQVHCMLASRTPGNEGMQVDPWIASAYYCSLDTESHAILRGMDMMGQHEYARRGYQFFIDRLNPAGYLAHGYTLMGTGQHLWFIDDHYKLTDDDIWWKGISSKMSSVCDWIIRQTDKTKQTRPNGTKVPEYGLLPPGTVADWQNWGYTFSMEGYYYAGISRAADSLKRIRNPKSDAYALAAKNLKKDIKRAFDETQSKSPVVELRDGTWVPYSPFQIGRPGPIDGYFPNEGISLYDVELGPHHMVDEGVIDPYSKQTDWMADYLEDTRFMESCPVAGCLPADLSEKDWFNRGGFPRSQPYYGRYPELCALRDDVKPFIRTYFNQLATMFNREDLSIYENPWASVWNKTHETGHFLQQSRMMFVMERDKELWLAPFVTSAWMKDNEQISVENAPTYFGNVSYSIVSHVIDGYIEASVYAKKSDDLKVVVIRIRHPEGKPIKSVKVNGSSYKNFDPVKEIVRLIPSDEQISVKIEY